MPLCPEGIRVGAWVKPFAAFKKNVKVAYAWEPVIFFGGGQPEPESTPIILRDYIAEPITMKRGLAGAKPEAVCWWAFDVLGLSPDDELHDLFPGTGAVSKAWDRWCSTRTLFDLMHRIVMFSGGVGSWGAARRTIERHGPENVTLLFADTLIEDEDLYRYLDETAAQARLQPLVRLEEGRDPWEVFHDKRFLGNSRIDPCSRILKRELMRKWMNANYTPETAIAVLGFDWSEVHRFERAKGPWEPWTIEAPLCDKPYDQQEGSDGRPRGHRRSNLRGSTGWASSTTTAAGSA